MPAYNAARYIDQALESALAQTVRDLEVIVADDGSSDGTWDKLRRWSAADRRVVCVRQGNRGVSAARNLALARSRGRFIALLDSDDTWEPSFVEAQLAVFRQIPGAAVVTGNVLNQGGALNGQPMWPPAGRPRVLSLADILAEEAAVCIMSVFKREVYETIGGFDETLRHSEDYKFWLRAAEAGFTVVQSAPPLGRYRRRPDSASADQAVMLDGILRVLAEMRERCPPASREAAIIDRQVARFERERLVIRGKAHLMAGSYRAAAESFAAAAAIDRSVKLRAVSALSRWTPGVLRQAYHLRFFAFRRADG